MLSANSGTQGIRHTETWRMPGRGEAGVRVRAKRVGCGADLPYFADPLTWRSDLLVTGHPCSGIAAQASSSRLVASPPCRGSDGHSAYSGGLMAGQTEDGEKMFLPAQMGSVR